MQLAGDVVDLPALVGIADLPQPGEVVPNFIPDELLGEPAAPAAPSLPFDGFLLSPAMPRATRVQTC